MNTVCPIRMLPLDVDVETKAVLKQLNLANKKLAELKGVARTIPNEDILIQTLTIQEARESSVIENIVTTQDELYRAGLALQHDESNPATKEVVRYGVAMREGFSAVRQHKLLTNNIIKRIQSVLVENAGGFRSVPGTVLKNNRGEIVYTPPQDSVDVARLMDNLEHFINEPDLQDIDPLIKLAMLHYQFESIHPFYDGNGRTGRIVCVLYLVIQELLDLPILYLSRYITRNKQDYYRLLQEIRNSDNSPVAWENWILYILKGIEETASETLKLVHGISELMAAYKKKIRSELPKIYSHDLLNCLFFSPYTKVEHLEEHLSISRPTASKYLEAVAGLGLLKKSKVWRQNYYINTALVNLFANGEQALSSEELIRTVTEP